MLFLLLDLKFPADQNYHFHLCIPYSQLVKHLNMNYFQRERHLAFAVSLNVFPLMSPFLVICSQPSPGQLFFNTLIYFPYYTYYCIQLYCLYIC